MATIQFYKRNQGKYTRTITLISAVVLVAIGAYVLGRDVLVRQAVYLRFGVPLLLVAAAGLLMVWIVNRPKSADFLIATEGEMKKVSWSSRKEVAGSTKVVIVTTLIMAAILFVVDMVFAWVFRIMGVMGVH